jgi:hypothetical protein
MIIKPKMKKLLSLSLNLRGRFACHRRQGEATNYKQMKNTKTQKQL